MPETLAVADDPLVWEGAEDVIDAGLFPLRQLESPPPIVHNPVLRRASATIRVTINAHGGNSPSTSANQSRIRHRQQHSRPLLYINSPRILRRPCTADSLDIPDITPRNHPNDMGWRCVIRLPGNVEVAALTWIFCGCVEEEVGEDGAWSA
jgi:hypothetical protein